MKNLLILFFAIIGLTLSAQQEAPPQGINYQAVVYANNNNTSQPGLDAPGQVLWNEDIGVQFSILSGSATGTLIYKETHVTSTDEFGMFDLVIGQGLVQGTQSFNMIDWGSGYHFLKVEVDKTGGTNYVEMSNQQLWSVPYALYSGYSSSSGYADSSAYADIAGNGLTGVTDNGDGTLTFTYYDGSTYTTAVLSGLGSVGPQGPAGADGQDGLSSYEIWLSQGNTGTEVDFLNGLTGASGNDGLDGTDGLSAYEIWLAQGNTGTEADFLTGITGPQGFAGINGIDGTDGQDGQSAYEIWISQGNTGTEQDFLNGVIGPQGPAGTNGIDGTDGQNGQDGLSAYETWINQGNTGTEADFLTGITGPQGPAGADGANGPQGLPGNDGATGPQGPQGPAGVNGIDGTNGIDGQDGLSAYDSWLAQGNTGTEADFLNGITGPAGNDGVDGQDGLSSYDAWLAQGNTGTQADFLNGITGPQGPAGADGTGILSIQDNGDASITIVLTDSTSQTINIYDSTLYSVGAYAPELGGYIIRLSPDGQHGTVVESVSMGETWYRASEAMTNPANHSVAGAVFSDWRLPSINEINDIYDIRLILGITSGVYWTSILYDGNDAYRLDFGSGVFYYNDNYFISNGGGILCVRSF